MKAVVFRGAYNIALEERPRPQIQDNYNNWTREQFISEINRLKVENEELKNNQDLTASERQTILQRNQQKLEQIQNVFDSKNTQQPTNNNFPTGLVVGGTLLVIISLVSILVIKKARKIKK